LFKYCCYYIILNFFTQSHLPKGWIGIKRLGLVCNGLINHSTNTQQLSWFLPTIKQSPNFTCSQLYDHLYTFFKSPGIIHAPQLFFQADNCFKENKNETVAVFLALLILFDWFKGVLISYLPKGHTHEDIDQLFSNMRIAMKYHDFDTLLDLLSKLLPKAYKSNRPVVTKVHPNIFNWKVFLKPYLPNLSGHSKPHVFHLERGVQNPQVCTCCMFF